MSDLFIGELLVLLLLVPVYVRPLFPSLQAMEGISVLPFVSFLIAIALAAGSGIPVSFLPVFCFSVVTLVSGFRRLVRLLVKLPTDWFSPASVFFHAFGCVVLVLVVIVSIRFAPEDPWVPDSAVRLSSWSEPAGTGVRARLRKWESEDPVAPKGVVCLTGDSVRSLKSRDTLAQLLASKGYTVLEAQLSGPARGSPLFALPLVRESFFLYSRLLYQLTGYGNSLPAQYMEEFQPADIRFLVTYSSRLYGSSIPVFAIAEGSACAPLQALFASSDTPVQGIALISPDTVPEEAVVLSGAQGEFPRMATRAPLFVITRGTDSVYGFGELAADDVLAARLLGANRDAGRKHAELLARRIETWLARGSAL